MANWPAISIPNTTSGTTRGDIMLLLTDGSVLVHNAAKANEWLRLTPADDGTYESGIWSSTITTKYTRQFFASGVFNDGRAFVVGGEYSNDPNDQNPGGGTGKFSPSGEVFDPATNSFTLMTSADKPTTMNGISGDVAACVLADGRVLMGDPVTATTVLWDPSDNSWVNAGTKFGSVSNTKDGNPTDEETWTLLPDGSVLTVEVKPSTANAAERYVPSLDAWVSASATKKNLVLASVNGVTVDEIGPAILLPNGKVFAVGATGVTGIYTPGSTANAKGSWADGPALPNSQTAIDAPAALLPTGRVLCMGGTTTKDSNGNYFSQGPVVYEFDPASSATTIPQLPVQPAISSSAWTWQCWMLLLPTGQVLCTDRSASLHIYTPGASDGTVSASWKPKIASAPADVVLGHTYTLSGTQFNGLSQAVSYGDDGQMATNFPIVRMRNTATGKTRYATTYGFSTMGVATGTATVTTEFDVPGDLDPGSYDLVVIANGIASDPVSVHVAAQDCYFEIDNSMISQGEVDIWVKQNPPLPAVFDPAFKVVLEGFTPSELGIDTTKPIAPQLANPPLQPSVNSPLAQLKVAFSGPMLPEDLAMPTTAQRFSFPFKVTMTDDSVFTNVDQNVTLQATFTSSAGVTVTNNGIIELTKKPNPYILHADRTLNPPLPWYLSVDIRVFQLKAGDPMFETSVASSGAASSVATKFIQSAIASLNGDVGNARSTFDGLPQEEDTAVLSLSPTDPADNKVVYNFAVARVRYRDTTQHAKNVRVFFRIWQSQQVNTAYNQSVTYRRTTNSHGEPIPLLGVTGDEIATIPFFATQRVTPGQAMNTQRDLPNVVTDMPPTSVGGSEVDRYFGCWLDINQPNDTHFPQRLVGAPEDGPYNTVSPLLPVQQFMRSGHHCLVAEVAFDPDPIPPSADPSNSDKLAQRNLAFVPAPNPGTIASRRVPQTFELKPTSPVLGPGLPPDELEVAWGAVPTGTAAEIYLPGAGADAIIALADQLYTTHRLSRVDAHTLRCPAAGLTYIPLPVGPADSLTALLTLDLPDGIRKGENFRVVVRQITSVSYGAEIEARNGVESIVAGRMARGQNFSFRRTAGIFALDIPVGTKATLLAPEERYLSIMRWIGTSVAQGSRWYLVFQRYLDQLASRVDAMGGDSGAVLPSPTGDWQHKHHEHHEGEGHEGEGHEDHDGERLALTQGKIVGIVHDHFGDFTGFLLETLEGDVRQFDSREHPLSELITDAWHKRLLVAVEAERHAPRTVISLVIRDR
jgi:hypothetical protein